MTDQTTISTATPTGAAAASAHLPLVDGLRGYLIFAMTVGHMIAITGVMGLNFLTHKPFAIFLTGEGFMAVSGFMTGYVLTLGWARRGLSGSALWGLRRAGKIVLHYLAVCALCVLPALVWPLEGSTASALFYGRSGFAPGDLALLAAGLYRPAFFDILYLYVVFLAIAPLFLALLRSRVWWLPLGLSGLAWLLTQYGLTGRAIAALFERLPARIEEAGSFHTFGWQFVFFAALAVGSAFARRPQSVRTALDTLRPTLPFALLGLGVFAVVGLASASFVLPLGLRYLEDYQTVAPLPLINFALAVLALALVLNGPGTHKGRAARLLTALLRLPPLRDIGRVTLQSFCASIVLSYWLAYALPLGAPVAPGAAVLALAGCLLGVWLVARVTLRLTRLRRAQKTAPQGAPF